MGKNQNYFNNHKNMQQRPVLPVVKNPEIEALIREYVKEKKMTVLDQLCAKLKTANVICPSVIHAETKKPLPALLKSSDGSLVLACYTGKEQMASAPKTAGIMVLPFEVLIRTVVKSETEIAGIVLNPFTQNLMLKKNLLQLIADGKSVQEELQKKAPAKEIKLTEEQVNQLERVKFEHQFLAERFFRDGSALLNDLAEKKEELVDELFEESYTNKRMYLYRTDEFSVFSFLPEDNAQVIRINMPERELTNMCAKKVYMICRGEEKYYFLITSVESDKLHLIQVTEKGEQLDLGEAPEEGQELFVILNKTGIEMQ